MFWGNFIAFSLGQLMLEFEFCEAGDLRYALGTVLLEDACLLTGQQPKGPGGRLPYVFVEPSFTHTILCMEVRRALAESIAVRPKKFKLVVGLETKEFMGEAAEIEYYLIDDERTYTRKLKSTAYFSNEAVEAYRDRFPNKLFKRPARNLAAHARGIIGMKSMRDNGYTIEKIADCVVISL